MYLTHSNSLYAEDITSLEHGSYPQCGHQVTDGGIVVSRGIKTMPAVLIEMLLNGKGNANNGTAKFIKDLTDKEDIRTGLILAAGGNIWTGYLPNVKLSDKFPTHKITPLGMTQIFAGQLANKLGNFEHISTDSTSCISGHAAWQKASMLIGMNILDAAVVVTVDNGLSEEYMSIFGQHGLAKLMMEENDPSITKFRLGQGCNISVFEGMDANYVSCNRVIAKVRDICIASESYGNPLGISETGEGYSKVIDRVDTRGIDFVKTHSTFSKDNEIEEQVVKESFGDIPLINYKLRIGHTMGASTAVETALAIREEYGTFLSLGAGMGNVFSSAVVEIVSDI